MCPTRCLDTTFSRWGPSPTTESGGLRHHCDTVSLSYHISVNYPRAWRAGNRVSIMREWFRARCHQNQICGHWFGTCVYVRGFVWWAVEIGAAVNVQRVLQGAPRHTICTGSRLFWAGPAKITSPKGRELFWCWASDELCWASKMQWNGANLRILQFESRQVRCFCAKTSSLLLCEKKYAPKIMNSSSDYSSELWWNPNYSLECVLLW